MNLFGLIFSLGGILGFITMTIYSYMFYSKARTSYIFGGGFIIAFSIEYALSITQKQYSYQNIPFTIFDIPIVIAAGWCVTFFGLLTISQDLTESKPKIIGLVAILGMMFGLGIETLARQSDFWTFHVEFQLIIGIPIVAIIAWGVSTANFAAGIMVFDHFDENKLLAIPLLIVTHLINLLIASLLSLAFT